MQARTHPRRPRPFLYTLRVLLVGLSCVCRVSVVGRSWVFLAKNGTFCFKIATRAQKTPHFANFTLQLFIFSYILFIFSHKYLRISNNYSNFAASNKKQNVCTGPGPP